MHRNENPPDDIESQMTVVSGLGGIGKTQLVREYVNQNMARYDSNVIWINGDKEESISETFKALANDTLEISTVGANGIEKNITSIVEEVYDYFSGKNVLFVYDNVESMESISKFLLLGRSEKNARPYVLVTSRVQHWHKGIAVIQLREWQPHEAIDFVSAVLDVNAQENLDVKLLVEDLQYFPLALRQATSYISYKDDTIANYRDKYAKQKKQLLDSKLFQNSASKYTETTFTTWNITMKSIEQDTELGSLAMQILNTIAYFHADNISRESLIHLADDATKGSIDRGSLGKYFIQLVVSEVFSLPAIYPTSSNDRKKPAVDKEDLLESAVSLLINYSMITSQERQTILSIHRVVQDVIQVSLKAKDEERKVLQNALRLVEKLMQRIRHTTHARSVFQHSLQYPHLVREFCELPNAILMNLITSEMKEDAPIFVNQFMEKFETILGSNHPVLGKIAYHLRYVKAYHFSRSLSINETGHRMYEELHQMRAEQFGQHDVDTLIVKFEIGQIFLRMGKVREAFTILEEANQQIELKLGVGHPQTLATEELIAVSYLQKGLYDDAWQRLNILYEKKKSLFGENSTKTLFTLNFIGRVLHLQEKYTQALEVFRKVCENNVELSCDHETRFRAMENMAHANNKLGNYEEAIKIYRDVLDRKSKALGDDHPDTLTTLADFGVILLDQWNVTEAIEVFQKICTNSVEKQENDEPTLITMKNLGLAYARLGDFVQADRVYRDILSTRIKLHGNNHPDCLMALNDIGELLLTQEKFAEALPIFEQIYENRIELDEESEIIVTSMMNIAYVHRMLENNEKSLEMYEQSHLHRTRTLGENHSETLRVSIEMAQVLEDMELYDDALIIYESIKEKEEELGEENLIVRVALKQIGLVYGRCGRYAEGLDILKTIYGKSAAAIGEDHPATLCAVIDIGILQINQKNYTDALNTFYDVYGKATKISENNEFAVIATRRLVQCYLGLENYIKSWQLYREGHSKNMVILEGSHLDNVREFIDTGIRLIKRGNCTEAFLIFMDMYKHRMSLDIADEGSIICDLKKLLNYTYNYLRSVRLIQKHLM